MLRVTTQSLERVSANFEIANLIAKTFNLDPTLITPVTSKDIPWVARRPKDSSLNVDKAKQTLKHKPLKIHEALEKLKEEIA